MANVKISGLPTASTPLTGAELVPVVQSGVTSQTTVSDFGAAVSYTPSGTGAVATTVQTKLRETVSVKDFGAVGDNSTNNVSAFKNALAAIKASGGGKLYVPVGEYKFVITSSSDCLLIDFDNLEIEFEAGAKIFYDYYNSPIFPIVGVSNVIINNAYFIWTGIRPASAGSANQFGFDGTGVISPPDWACHIAVAGSNYVKIRNAKWEGLTTSNNKECGIALFGGNSTGPSLDGGNIVVPGANAVWSIGNEVINAENNDVYFGIIGFMQQQAIISYIKSNRYKQSAFVGAAHAIYLTGAVKDSMLINWEDEGTFIDTPGTGTYTGCCSYKTNSLYNCILGNWNSSRIEGFWAISNVMQDCIGSNFQWAADVVAYESVISSSALNISNSSTYVISGNRLTSIKLFNKTNATAGRSANFPLMSRSGATYNAVNSYSNYFEVEIDHCPGVANNQSVFEAWGQNNTYNFICNNTGIWIWKNLVSILGDDPTRQSSNLILNIVLGGAARWCKVVATNSAGNNVVNITDMTSTTISEHSIATGDKIFYLSNSAVSIPYSATITLDTSQQTYRLIGTLTGPLTMAAPTNSYVGAIIEVAFTQDSTGGRVITWNSVFKKAADGAGTANQVANTKFQYNGAYWIQVGGAMNWY